MSHPAFGIWKDRTDLPQDPVEASRMLREQMMRLDAPVFTQNVKHFSAFPGLRVVRAY